MHRGFTHLKLSSAKRDHRKNQYERKFKLWDFRKYLTSDEWKYALCKKRKRGDAGKDSQITLNGRVIMEKRVKKDEGRYTLTEVDQLCCSGEFQREK